MTEKADYSNTRMAKLRLLAEARDCEDAALDRLERAVRRGERCEIYRAQDHYLACRRAVSDALGFNRNSIQSRR